MLCRDNVSLTVWSPALRSLGTWQEYLEFDFLTLARIGSVHIGGSAGGLTQATDVYRAAKRVRVEAAESPGAFTPVVELDLPANRTVAFAPALVARHVRIWLVTATSNGDLENTPIAVNE